ncbi:transmembrane protein 6/97 [Rhizoctonia solani]|nr:transmembrane protein 6/97 [Rhizoctonia solani]
MSRALSERPLDFLYFIFFVIHIPATLLMDLQAIIPPGVLSPVFRIIPEFYLSISGDPLIAGAMGLHGAPTQFTWFRTFIMIEGLFQLPVFFLGLYALKNDSPYTPILLSLYGCHVTTTVIPVLTTTLATPMVFTGASDTTPFASLNALQLTILMASYIPFLAVPLAMTIDGTRRMIRAVGRVQELEKLSKHS